MSERLERLRARAEWVDQHATVERRMLVDVEDVLLLLGAAPAEAGMTVDEALNDLADALDHDEAPDHRLCTQDCKLQDEYEHCFTCREPWPCSEAMA